MKDDKLEKEFEEYFRGVNTPDNITADAKKYVKSKSAFMPKFVKFASVAASFVLVLTATLLIIFGTRSSLPANDSSTPPANDLPDNEAGGSTGSSGLFVAYTDDDLTFTRTDYYGVSGIDPSLKFMQNLAYTGASVNNVSAGYMNGELALVKAEISLINKLSRHETEVYVEFTDENTVYSPLEDYFDGTAGSYKGVTFRLTAETAENGEPVNKLYFNYNNVKYYFNVTSTDENSYIKYLQTVIK